MQYLPQNLPEFGVGDSPDPLLALARQRHFVPQIRLANVTPLTPKEREALLDLHCAKGGKKHDFSVMTRRGMACLWCKMVERTT